MSHCLLCCTDDKKGAQRTQTADSKQQPQPVSAQPKAANKREDSNSDRPAKSARDGTGKVKGGKEKDRKKSKKEESESESGNSSDSSEDESSDDETVRCCFALVS